MNVELMSVKDLVMNEMASKIYSKPRNYELIRRSIENRGVINPIIVNEDNNMIISGNLRYTITKDLNREFIRVIKVQLGENQDINELLLLSNLQREKSLLDKYNENEYINSLFKLRQGARIDLSQELREEKERKKQMKKILSLAEIDYFSRINNLAKKKFGEENYQEKIIEGLKNIDDGEITRNAFKLFLEGEKSTQKDQNKKKEKPNVTTLNKEMAMVEIQKILKRVAVDLHEEILLHFLNKQIYNMAG
jgi:ParB-like chromosome segregation protein Spo0J